ncbi:MAG: hypothetical protein WBD27_00995 [Pyrinomonadaceae bacterium]
MNKLDSLVKDLPDAESATRFLKQFTERHPSKITKLQKNEGLLSDALTLASFSPLFAATLIQNPDYLWWLNRKRAESSVRNKEELLESLARFSLTNSQIEPNVLFTRFRRRELLRIFLRDIRRLGTIAEITEEISNLADAILENALRIARQELDNRFGSPFEIDAKGRRRPSDICIVSLGKLGSKELNYSSDIDLLFIYSAEGSTTGNGSRGEITNREYFVKLAESITKLVGRQTGEGAAYRVDLRLRPHGRVGALALSVKETIRYYKTEAQSWERQVLIRSRSSSGKSRLFKIFFDAVENEVFSATEDVATALRNVYRSKEQIDFEHRSDKEFDVKLGGGGIREIEFIAQALQLSYAGKDKWLRAPHTLISISRLADRGLLSETELTGLFEAYDFLRHLEHILQMENGLQTHSLPNDPDKRLFIAKRMRFAELVEFEQALTANTDNVRRAFVRVFGENAVADGKNASIDTTANPDIQHGPENIPDNPNILQTQLFASIEKSNVRPKLTPERLSVIDKIAEVSPKFTELLTAKPHLLNSLKMPGSTFPERDYRAIFMEALKTADDLGTMLAAVRTTWSQLLLEIAVHDIFEKLPAREIKHLQTKLAEASIEIALDATRKEISQRMSIDIHTLPIAVLALGKLGSGTIDYDSDLDLVLIYDDNQPTIISDYTNAEFFSRAIEIFVTILSSMTRDGNLYRVDLRLRPHGKNGPSISTKSAFVEYIEREASIWEMLAYVQIRAVSGDIDLAKMAENEIGNTIRSRAARENPDELRLESKRIRLKLEEQHSTERSGKNIDIKFGAGGLLDVYFVVRYLHLRSKTGNNEVSRSTAAKLEELYANGELSAENFANLSEGYAFLSELDHNIRLMIGRVSRLPRANQSALERIAARMHSGSAGELFERLTVHRLNIRAAFESILY